MNFSGAHRDQVSPAAFFQTQHAFGLYSDAEYRANRPLDHRRPLLTAAGHATNAKSDGTLAFPLSSPIGPASSARSAGSTASGISPTRSPLIIRNANEFLCQFLFVMGAHGAHPF